MEGGGGGRRKRGRYKNSNFANSFRIARHTFDDHLSASIHPAFYISRPPFATETAIVARLPLRILVPLVNPPVTAPRLAARVAKIMDLPVSLGRIYSRPRENPERKSRHIFAPSLPHRIYMYIYPTDVSARTEEIWETVSLISKRERFVRFAVASRDSIYSQKYLFTPSRFRDTSLIIARFTTRVFNPARRPFVICNMYMHPPSSPRVHRDDAYTVEKKKTTCSSAHPVAPRDRKNSNFA